MTIFASGGLDEDSVADMLPRRRADRRLRHRHQPDDVVRRAGARLRLQAAGVCRAAAAQAFGRQGDLAGPQAGLAAATGADGRMAGDILSLESDEQAGEPLIQLVMQDGRGVAPSPTLGRHPGARRARSRAAAGALAPAGAGRILSGAGGGSAGAARRRGRPPPGAAGKGRSHDAKISRSATATSCWWSMSRTTSVPGGSARGSARRRGRATHQPLAARFEHVVLTQDWHPPGHLSFASTHPGRSRTRRSTSPTARRCCGRTIACRGRRAPSSATDLQIPHAELVLRKGYHREIDSYSAFYENDRKTQTGLAGYLRERGFTRVFLAGLAFDFCVRYSAEDAQREGFDVVVVEDACRASMSMARWRRLGSFAALGIVRNTAEAIG